MFASLLIIVLFSVCAFILYGYDKICACNDFWRVPESVLLFVAASGGAMGALLAMYVFRHKTQKQAFANGIPVMIFLQTILLIIVANIFLYE